MTRFSEIEDRWHGQLAAANLREAYVKIEHAYNALGSGFGKLDTEDYKGLADDMEDCMYVLRMVWCHLEGEDIRKREGL